VRAVHWIGGPRLGLRQTYLSLEKSWLAYKDALLAAPPSPQGARKVMALSEEVLALAQQGTVQLETLGGANVHLVNLAGRERMLSQRAAKLYQAQAWAVADGTAPAEIERMRQEYAYALRELEGASGNSAAIRDQLALGRSQWSFFEIALKSRSDDKRTQATHVATTSERLLEVMDTLTELYEKQSR